GRVVRRERRLGMLGRTERRFGFRFRVLPGERGLHHRVGRRRLAGGGRGWGVVFPHPELPPFRGGGPGGVRLPPFRGRPPLGWCGPARCRIKTVSHDDPLPWKSPHHSGLLRACAALARGGAARYPTRCNQRTGTPAPAQRKGSRSSSHACPRARSRSRGSRSGSPAWDIAARIRSSGTTTLPCTSV